MFLRAHAPVCGFAGPSAIACVVRDAIERAGVCAPTKGAHQFRHALATQMFLDYVGRYTHRVAISNQWLLGMDDGQIRFTYKDYRADPSDASKTMTPADSFAG